MKKIVIGLTVVLMTVVSYAASVNWSLAMVSAQSEGQDVSKYTAYLVDSSVSVDTFFSNLASGKTDGISATKTLTKFGTSGTGMITGLVATDATTGKAFTDGKTYSFYSIILNGDASNATHYIATTTMSDSGSGSTDVITMIFGSQNGATWQPIPEPTSGLLLLVGGALLALRRKQK